MTKVLDEKNNSSGKIISIRVKCDFFFLLRPILFKRLGHYYVIIITGVTK